jgi:hypothetical protein
MIHFVPSWKHLLGQIVEPPNQNEGEEMNKLHASHYFSEQHQMVYTKLLKQSDYEIKDKLKVANEIYNFSNCNKTNAPPRGCTHHSQKLSKKSNVVTCDQM